MAYNNYFKTKAICTTMKQKPFMWKYNVENNKFIIKYGSFSRQLDNFKDYNNWENSKKKKKNKCEEFRPKLCKKILEKVVKQLCDKNNEQICLQKGC